MDTTAEIDFRKAYAELLTPMSDEEPRRTLTELVQAVPVSDIVKNIVALAITVLVETMKKRGIEP